MKMTDFWAKEARDIVSTEVLEANGTLEETGLFSDKDPVQIFISDAPSSEKHKKFFLETASEIYNVTLNEGFSPVGILISIAWASLEGGWGEKGTNPFGIVGVGGFSTLQDGINAWVSLLKHNKFNNKPVNLLRQSVINSDDFNYALNTAFYTNNGQTYNGDKSSPAVATKIRDRAGNEVQYLDYGFSIVNRQVISVLSRINTSLKEYIGTGILMSSPAIDYLLEIRKTALIFDMGTKVGSHEYHYDFYAQPRIKKQNGVGGGNITEIQTSWWNSRF